MNEVHTEGGYWGKVSPKEKVVQVSSEVLRIVFSDNRQEQNKPDSRLIQWERNFMRYLNRTLGG